MNFRRLHLLLLLVCVFSSVLCLNTRSVHAEEIKEPDITIEMAPDNVIDENTPMIMADEYIDQSSMIYAGGMLYRSDGFSGGFDFFHQSHNFESKYSYGLVHKVKFPNIYDRGNMDFTIYYASKEVVNPSVKFQLTNDSDGLFSLISPSRITFIPSKVENGVEFASYYIIEYNDLECQYDFTGFRLQFDFSLSENQGVEMKFPLRVEITYNDETSGLLGGIIEIVRNIFTGITNLPGNIANSIKGFFDNIVNSLVNLMNVLKNAIVDLGNFLIDGIKNLFVPSSEDLQVYFDNWKALLSDRFGALYEVFDIIVGYFEQFTSVSGNSTIVFPSVSIPLAGAVFEFGGWSVSLIPEGFEVVFSALRLMISIICTIAFVNALRRRYDKVVEK